MTRRGRRLALIAVALAVIGVAAGVALYALNDSIVFFLSPAEVVAKGLHPGARLRVGGLVKAGTLVKSPGENEGEMAGLDDHGQASASPSCQRPCFINTSTTSRGT